MLIAQFEKGWTDRLEIYFHERIIVMQNDTNVTKRGIMMVRQRWLSYPKQPSPQQRNTSFGISQRTIKERASQY